MAAAAYTLTPQAEQDLLEIWAFIAKDNIDAADRLIERMYERAGHLAEHPRMGRLRPELDPGIRSFTLDSYVIFYRPIEGGVEILRCAHGARDIETLF